MIPATIRNAKTKNKLLLILLILLSLTRTTAAVSQLVAYSSSSKQQQHSALSVRCIKLPGNLREDLLLGVHILLATALHTFPNAHRTGTAAPRVYMYVYTQGMLY